MAELVVLAVLGTSIWVAIDAPNHGLSWTWGLGCLLLWIVAFPWYLIERGKHRGLDAVEPAGPAAAPPTALASWYPDPWRQASYRYWDGNQWTGHTSGVLR